MKIDSTIFKASIKIGEERAKVIEQLIELHLQPKPYWLPRFIWRWLIKRLLSLKVVEQ